MKNPVRPRYENRPGQLFESFWAQTCQQPKLAILDLPADKRMFTPKGGYLRHGHLDRLISAANLADPHGHTDLWTAQGTHRSPKEAAQGTPRGSLHRRSLESQAPLGSPWGSSARSTPGAAAPSDWARSGGWCRPNGTPPGA